MGPPGKVDHIPGVARGVRYRERVTPPTRPYPIALLLGLVVGVAGTLASAVASIWIEYSPRWQLFDIGCSGLAYLLSIYGLFDLSNRLTGQARSGLRIAASLFLVGMVWMFLRPVVEAWLGASEKMFDVWQWGGRVVGLTAFAGTLAITIAADAWRRLPVAAVFAIIAALLTGWLPVVGEKLMQLLFDHRVVWRAFWPVREAAWAACILVMVLPLARSARPSVPDPLGAASGFRLAAAGLKVWLVGAIVIAGMSIVMTKSPGTQKLILIGGPCLAIVALVLCGWGMLGGARARVDGLPRLAFCCGAGMVAWWAALAAQQTASLYASLGGDSFRSDDGWLDKWTILGPLVAAAGMALVGTAISSLAQSRGDATFREAASLRTVLFVILMAGSVGLTTQIESASLGTQVALALAAAGTKIGGLIVLAGLFDRAARSLEQAGLPTARVV